MALHSGPIVLAHPLTQTYELPVSPLVVAVVALCLAVGVAYVVWQRTPAAEGAVSSPAPHPRRFHGVWFLTRAVGLALFLLAVVAGLFGDESNLRNITTALVVGAGWPLLVVSSLALGDVWWWIDPFDSLARITAPLGAGDGDAEEAQPVWLATVPAALLVAYLTVWPGNLAPRSVASALGLYAFAMVAGSMAVGRRPWLRRVDVFRLFFGCLARARHPSRWYAPDGTHLVLGVLCGGVLFGLLRDSQLFVSIGYGPNATVYSSLALAVTIVIVAALADAAVRRHAARAAAAAVALALTWAAAGLALALALARNRLTTSLQLLPQVAWDPLGTRVDPLADFPLKAMPLGVTGLLVLQVAVLVAAHLVAAVVAARHVRRRGGHGPVPPAVFVVSTLLSVGAAAVAATAFGS